MSRFVCLLWAIMSISLLLQANNIRVTRDISIDKAKMTNDVAEINFAIEWENSWRDDFNWDAAYVFLKCRKKGVAEWGHVQLRPSYQKVSNGYDCWVANTADGAVAQGIFIYRNKNGAGTSSVDVTLQWLYTRNGLTKTDFMDDKVEYTAMCIETVYVPNGAFYAGDNFSAHSFQSSYRPILEKWDLIGLNKGLTFDADGTVESRKNYPPENAANHVNMNGGSLENAWYATQANARWQVTFPNDVTIRSFGVSGVSGYPVPSVWQLQGRKAGGQWIVIFNGTAGDWPSGSTDSYPVNKALTIPDPAPYREYMISVTTCAGLPALNNISMTDQDLSAKTDFAYVIDNNNTPIPLNTTRGLFANDKDTWNTTLSAAYPSGFFGFFAMKYEMSQEQYVKFLNKLSLVQQKRRTIGNTLTDLKVGDFVYGTDRTKPNTRNGIMLMAESNNGSPVVFGNNYNFADGSFSQPDDGLAIACNYLSPEDMMAYADWTGLRPMSELEYEKTARASFPDLPEQGEWAWGSGDRTTLAYASTISAPGSAAEKVTGANVNANKQISGPVRCGSFASRALSPIAAGASYWGLMELSGNLAEICYNVNTEGRTFQGISAAHGDGALDANGCSNAPNWPIKPVAFTLRGGSYDNNELEIASSYRKDVGVDYPSDINDKNSQTTFRLVHSCGMLQAVKPITYLQLANGQVAMSDGAAQDTVCSASAYTITGSDLLSSSTVDIGGRKDIPLSYKGRCEFIWYISENGGTTWNIIPGEREINLTYNKYINDASIARTVWVRRLMITPQYTSLSPYIKLNVINNSYKVYPALQRDTIKMNNAVNGCLVTTKTPAKFTWRWKGQGNAPLRQVVTNGVSDFYTPARADFNNISDASFTVQCEIQMQKCIQKTDFTIFVKTRPKTAVLSNNITIDGPDPLKECGVMMMDARDNGGDGIYGTVRIGNQCWMTENLRHAVSGYTYRQPSDSDGKKLGSFYKYSPSVLNDACPSGWSLPSPTDFNNLKAALDDGYASSGLKLKAGNYWGITGSNLAYWGNNSSGFSAIGSGYFSDVAVGVNAFYLLDNGYYFRIDNEATDIVMPGGAGGLPMSIRCVRNFSK